MGDDTDWHFLLAVQMGHSAESVPFPSPGHYMHKYAWKVSVFTLYCQAKCLALCPNYNFKIDHVKH